MLRSFIFVRLYFVLKFFFYLEALCSGLTAVFWTGILSNYKSILAAEMYNVVLLHCAGCACVRFSPAVFVVVSCYYCCSRSFGGYDRSGVVVV